MLSVKKKIEKTKVSSLRQIDNSRSMVFLLKCLKPIDLWCMFFFFWLVFCNFEMALFLNIPMQIKCFTSPLRVFLSHLLDSYVTHISTIRIIFIYHFCNIYFDFWHLHTECLRQADQERKSHLIYHLTGFPLFFAHWRKSWSFWMREIMWIKLLVITL